MITVNSRKSNLSIALKTAIALLSAIFLFSQGLIVQAQNKGGFFILDYGPSGQNYVTGGTALIDWRDFEPVEGQYNWNLSTDPNGRFVS